MAQSSRALNHDITTFGLDSPGEAPSPLFASAPAPGIGGDGSQVPAQRCRDVGTAQSLGPGALTAQQVSATDAVSIEY